MNLSQRIGSIAVGIAGIVLLSASSVQGAVITGVTVADFSTENVVGLDLDADYTVNGAGLTGTGAAGSVHSNAINGTLWNTGGSLGGNDPSGTTGVNDFDPFITFDLGDVYAVDTIRIWNYNGVDGQSFSLLGPDDIELFAGLTLGSLTSQGSIAPLQASATNGELGEDFAVGIVARYIQFDIKSNYDGAIFGPAEIGANGGANGLSLTGLSEVRFEGVIVPEPSSGFLLLFGAIVVGLATKLRRDCR